MENIQKIWYIIYRPKSNIYLIFIHLMISFNFKLYISTFVKVIHHIFDSDLIEIHSTFENKALPPTNNNKITSINCCFKYLVPTETIKTQNLKLQILESNQTIIKCNFFIKINYY